MAGLSPADIAAPIRSILNTQRNVTVLLGEGNGIDFERRILRLRDGEPPFDDLLLATGGRTSYFGHDLRGQPSAGLRTAASALQPYWNPRFASLRPIRLRCADARQSSSDCRSAVDLAILRDFDGERHASPFDGRYGSDWDRRDP